MYISIWLTALLTWNPLWYSHFRTELNKLWKTLKCVNFYLYSFTVHVVIVHCLKTQLMHYALKYTLTQSLFKTLECLHLLCHPTCFGHILDHLQGMFLVQCYFPPGCFVTILLGYVVVSSICVVVMYTSLLSVLLCTVS